MPKSVPFQLKLFLLKFTFRIGSMFFQITPLVADHCPFKVESGSFEVKTKWMTTLHDVISHSSFLTSSTNTVFYTVDQCIFFI